MTGKSSEAVDAELRPCDVLVKALMNKNSAPMDENEVDIINGYLMKLNLVKLGQFGKKCITEQTDEQFGEMLRARFEGILKNARKKKAA